MKNGYKYIIFPLSLAAFESIVYLSNDMYTPALPEITHHFNTTSQLSQLTITSWLLGAFFLQLFLGPLSDAYGRRPILFYGIIIFILATLSCAISPNIYSLLIARFFEGTVVCSISVAGYAAIHESHSKNEAIKITALMSSITILAPGMGPLLGSVMLLMSDWRFIFWLLAIVAAIVSIILFEVMPETLPKIKRQPIQLKLILRSYQSIALNKEFLSNTLTSCLLFSSTIGWMATGPFLVIDQFHSSPTTFGLYQILIFGSFTIGTRLVRRFLDVLGPDRIIFFGSTTTLFAGITATVVTFLFPNCLFGFIICTALFSLGTGLCFSALIRKAIETSNQLHGMTMALFSTLMSLFAAIGSGFLSLFYNGSLKELALYFLCTAALASTLQWRMAHENIQSYIKYFARM